MRAKEIEIAECHIATALHLVYPALFGHTLQCNHSLPYTLNSHTLVHTNTHTVNKPVQHWQRARQLQQSIIDLHILTVHTHTHTHIPKHACTCEHTMSCLAETLRGQCYSLTFSFLARGFERNSKRAMVHFIPITVRPFPLHWFPSH